MNTERLRESLIKHEGLRLKPYICTAGKLAVGVGRNLYDSPVDKSAWATYRQELRDISAQADFPWTVEWPTQPQ